MIHADNLSVSYGDVPVLKNLSVDFPAGQITTITGANGCGKSTLLHTLSRLLSPQTGCMRINGRDIGAMKRKELAKILALLPQSPHGSAGHRGLRSRGARSLSTPIVV